MESLDILVEPLAALAVAHPRVAGVMVAAGAALAVVGMICAQVDTDALERAGHPRLAHAIRIGARVGAFALKLQARKESAK